MNGDLKIIINGKFLTQRKTGVQRYATALLDQFDKLLTEINAYKNIQLSVYAPPLPSYQHQWRNIKIYTFGATNHQYWEQVQLPMALKGELLFSPTNIGPIVYKRQVVTLHDASVYATPDAYTLPFKLKYYLLLSVLAKQAKSFITDSAFSSGEIQKYLRVPAERLTVIPLGGDHMSRIPPDLSASTLTKLELTTKEYLLLVGSRSRHKNTAMVYETLAESGFSGTLVHIGGSNSEVFGQQQRATQNFKVVDPGYIDDIALKTLYQNAQALIFPSTYEGFGFPPLEAMNEGCPVICSNAASLPEVVGNAALTFDPRDKEQLRKCLDTIFTDEKTRVQLTQKGFDHARKFTWRSTAEQTLNELIRIGSIP